MKGMFRMSLLAGVALIVFVGAGLILTPQTHAVESTCGPYKDVPVVGSTSGVVWGSGPYGISSDMGTAAVHAGLIKVGEVATIHRTSAGRISTFNSSVQNGVSSFFYTQSMCAVTLTVVKGDVGGGTTSPSGPSDASQDTVLSAIAKLLELIIDLQKQLVALKGGTPSEVVACTMDAKMCPDGSYVGRVAPSCSFAACPGTVTASSNKFMIGDSVRVTAALNIRSTPSITGTRLDTAYAGSLGTVLAGPTNTSDGITWWKIDYAKNSDGWSSEKYLSKVSSSVVTTPPTSGTGTSGGGDTSAIRGWVTKIDAPSSVYYNTPFTVSITMKNPTTGTGLVAANVGIVSDPSRSVSGNGDIEKVLKAGESYTMTKTFQVDSSSGPTKGTAWLAEISSLYAGTGAVGSEWTTAKVNVLPVPYDIFLAHCNIYTLMCPENVYPGAPLPATTPAPTTPPTTTNPPDGSATVSYESSTSVLSSANGSSACVIPRGGVGGCSITVDWTTSQSTSAKLYSGSQEVASGLSGSKAFSLTPGGGETSIKLVVQPGNVEYGSSLSARCASGSTWGGSKCVVNAAPTSLSPEQLLSYVGQNYAEFKDAYCGNKYGTDNLLDFAKLQYANYGYSEITSNPPKRSDDFLVTTYYPLSITPSCP